MNNSKLKSNMIISIISYVLSTFGYTYIFMWLIISVIMDGLVDMTNNIVGNTSSSNGYDYLGILFIVFILLIGAAIVMVALADMVLSIILVKRSKKMDVLVNMKKQILAAKILRIVNPVLTVAMIGIVLIVGFICILLGINNNGWYVNAGVILLSGIPSTLLFIITSILMIVELINSASM